MFETYKFNLRVLTPMHIGCGDAYEPFEFAVDMDSILVFDPEEFLGSLASDVKKEFSKTCEKGTLESIWEIYRFIRKMNHADHFINANHYKEGKAKKRKVPACSGFVEHYKVMMDNNRDLNRLEIKRTIYNPVNAKPYIPGSSLKGSLRTGHLNNLAKQKEIRNYPRARDLENELLGGAFASDPFSLVKVSDFRLIGEQMTRIWYCVNVKKNTNFKLGKGPYQIWETIRKGALFSGEINLHKPRGSGIKSPITKADLFKASDLYKRLFDAEEVEMKRILPDYTAPDLDEYKSKFGKTAILMRVGGHSGAEAVTIEGNRKIKVKTGASKFETKDKSTTLWLAGESNKPQKDYDLVPFGWCVLELIS